MATSTSARTGSIQTRSPQRLSTETKHAFKTTEFVAYLAVVVGILVSAALIKGGDTVGGAGAGGTDEFTAHQAWLYVAIVTVGYMISRGLAKAGSRDPYWADGTNQNRDTDNGNR
jgi:hypothetical protein